MYTGIRSSRNRISVFQFLLEQEHDFGPFFLLGLLGPSKKANRNRISTEFVDQTPEFRKSCSCSNEFRCT